MNAIPNPPEEFNFPTVGGVIQGLPNSIYQRIDAVSQTQLKVFRQSPFHYLARHVEPVPEVFLADDDQSDEMFCGELAHCMTLEAAAFEARYIIGPQVKSRALKAWKDFVAAHPDRIAITPRQHAVAQAQCASLRGIAAVAEILDGGQCELSTFWVDRPTGLRCRCRPDCANPTFGTTRDPQAMILDVKTCRDASRRGVQLAIARYGYHHQAAWYAGGYAAATGVPVAGFIFAFVESEYPFAASVYELDAEAWEIAARENRQALEALAHCWRENRWPGYSPEVESIGLPRWAGGTGDY
jgi:exodeoxyribonuclease VIII